MIKRARIGKVKINDYGTPILFLNNLDIIHLNQENALPECPNTTFTLKNNRYEYIGIIIGPKSPTFESWINNQIELRELYQKQNYQEPINPKTQKIINAVIILLLTAVLFLVFLGRAHAQDSTKDDFNIFSHYAGFLYKGVYEDNEKQDYVTHTGTTRIGLRANTDIGFGKINTDLWNDNFDLKTTRCNLWYENNFSWINVRFGPRLPRPITQHHVPNPVTMSAHFLPDAKGIIPAAVAGANCTIKNMVQGNSLQFGISKGRSNGKRMIEYGMNVEQKWDNSSINMGGFFSKSTAGIAISMDMKNISGTYFRNADSLQSLFLSINTQIIGIDAGDIFLNTVNNFQKNTFSPLQIRITRNMQTQVNGTTVKTLVGFGYQIKPTPAGNVYLLFSF